MATPELSARLRYLNESAHLLATTAPAMSRHLMSQHNSFLFDNNIDMPDENRRRACGACGTIMVLGLEATVGIERPLRKKGRKNSSATKAMVYTCNCCGRETRHSIPPAPKPHRPKTGSLKATSTSAPPPAVSQLPPNSSAAESSNSTSRKRPNKKHGGLKALLAKQKASQSSSSSGFGLDLMDFMKG